MQESLGGLTSEQRQELEKHLLPTEQLLWSGRSVDIKTSLWTDIWELLGVSTSEFTVSGARQYANLRRTYAVTNQRVLLVDDADVAAQSRHVITLDAVDPQSLKILIPERNGTVGTVQMEQNKKQYVFGRIENPQLVKDLIFRTFS